MAKLADDPVERDLEDFVAAHLASRGAFVETGVTDRDPEDILELDVVWTDYRDPGATRSPIEIKSKDWSLGDLFKYFGWTRYLGLPPGSFVCRQLPGRLDRATVDRLAARTEISIIHIDDVATTDERFAAFGLPDPSAAHLPQLWRFSYWAQRQLLRVLKSAIDLDVCPQAACKAKDYFKLINDATFFEPDVRVRVEMLLDSHNKHRKLALTTAAEIGKRGFVLEDPPETPEFSAALYRGDHFPIQSVLYLEHRARLALIKAAVDYITAKRTNALPARIIRIFDLEFEAGDLGLYKAFKETTEELADAPSVQHYAVLWQVFLWAWGGFILKDRQDEEFKALSIQTQVPVGEISRALGMFDKLFPTPGGWFANPTDDARMVLKLMPAAIRGIGAYSRLLRYQLDEYPQFGFTDRTSQRLAVDHNTVVRLLDAGRDSAKLVK